MKQFNPWPIKTPEGGWTPENIYRVVGKIHRSDGCPSTVDRTVYSNCPKQAAVHVMAFRNDSGSPWYGDAVTVQHPASEQAWEIPIDRCHQRGWMVGRAKPIPYDRRFKVR